MSSRPLLVVTNDDGVDAPGLAVLANALRRSFDVLVVAPETQQSAVGHAITLSGRWRLGRNRDGFYRVSGTPADCVYVALFRLASRRPSLVVSGINEGYNLGTDVLYSGTVAAAAEAALLGLPGVALSAAPAPTPDVFQSAAAFARDLVSWLLDVEGGTSRQGREGQGGSGPTDPGRHPWLLNVNVPPDAQAAYQVTALGARRYPRPEPQPVHWPEGDGAEPADVAVEVDRPRVWGADGAVGPDADAVRRGVISVTSLRLGTMEPANNARDFPERLGIFTREGAQTQSVQGSGFESRTPPPRGGE